jgi:hypothetical protein
MSAAYAVQMFALAERALRSFGACDDVVEAYELAAVALHAAGQTYLASVAWARAATVSELA